MTGAADMPHPITLLQLRVLYHNVKVVMAPLLSGAGVKGKVRFIPRVAKRCCAVQP